VTDEALHARIDAAVGGTPLPLESGLPPMAASFITHAMLWRVRERLVHRVRDGHTCGWLLQASLARAVADMTGAPMGIPPNDWRAQKFGNRMSTAISNYLKRRQKARKRRSPEVMAQVQRDEDELCYIDIHLALGQPPSEPEPPAPPDPPSEPPPEPVSVASLSVAPEPPPIEPSAPEVLPEQPLLPPMVPSVVPPIASPIETPIETPERRIFSAPEPANGAPAP
jgi:hypothetical protein